MIYRIPFQRTIPGRYHERVGDGFRLASIKEGDGTLQDHTLVYYGSSNSRTHIKNNYPLILAGGKAMGYRHGQFLKFGANVPFSNLHLSMLHRMGVDVESFQDSTGELTVV